MFALKHYGNSQSPGSGLCPLSRNARSTRKLMDPEKQAWAQAPLSERGPGDPICPGAQPGSSGGALLCGLRRETTPTPPPRCQWCLLDGRGSFPEVLLSQERGSLLSQMLPTPLLHWSPPPSLPAATEPPHCAAGPGHLCMSFLPGVLKKGR